MDSRYLDGCGSLRLNSGTWRRLSTGRLCSLPVPESARCRHTSGCNHPSTVLTCIQAHTLFSCLAAGFSLFLPAGFVDQHARSGCRICLQTPEPTTYTHSPAKVGGLSGTDGCTRQCAAAAEACQPDCTGTHASNSHKRDIRYAKTGQTRPQRAKNVKGKPPA